MPVTAIRRGGGGGAAVVCLVQRRLLPPPGRSDKIVGRVRRGTTPDRGTAPRTKFVVLGFDVRQSDLPLRIAWPVFLLNTINWFVEEDSEYLSSFKTGEVWHMPVPLGAASSATLVDPTGARHLVPVQDGRAVFFGSKAGFYRCSSRLGRPRGPT